MKDGFLSKLTITDGSNRATQHKKISDALPVFCGVKGYRFVDEIISKNTELTQADFQETYPLTTQWSTNYHLEIDTVNPNVTAVNGICTPIKDMAEKIHVFTQIFRNSY